MSQDSQHNVIDVHIDTLEYTREGLRTRDPIDLPVGTHTKIRLIRPKRLRPVRPASTGFPDDSAFPLPGTLAVAWSLKQTSSPFAHSEVRVEAGLRSSLQVFGHTSASGDDDHNKRLSEQRARAGVALLRSSPDSLRDCADTEGWGLQHAQAMLRTMALDPGPVDGEPGKLTQAAFDEFRSRYNRGVFHRHSPFPRAPPDLPEAPPWGDDLKSAILDAFVAAHGAAIDAASITRTVGCSEFNAVAVDSPGHNRRLSVVASSTPPDHLESAPCTDGDAAACAVVDQRPQRCLWYREHVLEPAPAAVEFFDPRWLWFGEDKYVLSVLTTAADKQAFEFEVFDDDPDHGESLAVIGPIKPVLGTLCAVWRSARATADEGGRPDVRGRPTFRVRSLGEPASIDGPWREYRTARVLVGVEEGSSVSESEVFELAAADGSYASSVPMTSAIRISPRKVALVFERVPEQTLLSLAFGVEGKATFPLFESVKLEDILQNCSNGTECKEVPVLEPPRVPPEGAQEHFDKLPEFESEDEHTQHPPW